MPSIPATGYAARHSFTRLKPFRFEREAAGPGQVEIEVLFCGICHTDIHQAKNDWGNTVYPCIPGHEMTGRVRAVGPGVNRHAVGDLVGVGYMVDSCQTCEFCQAGEENYCAGPNSFLQTYNGPVVPAQQAATGQNTYGREEFVLRLPPGMDPASAAPILCAGVTTYSPLRHWKVGPGSRVGIVGLGGLGHMAVKLAVALGAEVTVFTHTEQKEAEALRLSATAVVMEKDAKSQAKQMAATAGRFDFILSTIPQKHDINPYLVLLKRDATMAVVGAIEPLAPVNNQAVAFHRRNVSGSFIGSIRETQEVLEFCAAHGIKPDIELIPIQQVNEAFSKVEDGEARFRYVIDMASLRQETADA